jgi:hypothetical protein
VAIRVGVGVRVRGRVGLGVRVRVRDAVRVTAADFGLVTEEVVREGVACTGTKPGVDGLQ